jgi:hypothetical protein
VTILLFLSTEGIALASPEKGDTFSEHIWSLVRPDSPWTWQRYMFAASYIVLFGWLFAHFFFGFQWPFGNRKEIPPTPEENRSDKSNSV